jgi:hypothetical protein
MKRVVTLTGHSACHRSSGALRKRCTEAMCGRSETAFVEAKRLSFRLLGPPRVGGTLKSELAELLWPNVSSLLHVPQIPSLARSGVGSWALRRLTLVPSIIVPGEEELPARYPRQTSRIEAESFAPLCSVPRVERRIRCLKLFHHPLGVIGLQANHRHPSPAWLGRHQPHRFCRYAQAPTGLQVPVLLLAPSVRKLLQKSPPRFFLFS